MSTLFKTNWQKAVWIVWGILVISNLSGLSTFLDYYSPNNELNFFYSSLFIHSYQTIISIVVYTIVAFLVTLLIKKRGGSTM